MPEGISNVIRRTASMTVVVAVSGAVRFCDAKVVFARVTTGEATGRALHEIVLVANWTLVRKGNVFVNVERLLRSAAVSGEVS